MPISHDAFVSYSHAVDGARAAALEQGLEKLAKPMFKLRALDVFRDQTSLAASPGLWPGIVEHLAGSTWFLLMASPASAASSWCNREVDWWLDNRSPERMLIILTDGGIVWDGAANDFDWSRTTALARNLAGRFANEPLYVDLRWAAEPQVLSLTNPRFRDAIVDVGAPLRGMRKDELDSADVRQLRRNRRFVQAGVALISVAAAVAIWQAVVANAARREAERQRDEAIAGRLAVEARDARAGKQLDLALLLATASFRIRPTPQAESILLDAFAPRHQPVAFLDAGSSVETLASSSDGRLLASGSANGTVTMWDLQSRQTLGKPFDVGGGPVHTVAFSPDDRWLAAGTQNGTVLLWDVSTRKGLSAPTTLKRHRSTVSSVRFSPDSQLLGSSGEDGFVLLWNVHQPEPIADLAAKATDSSWYDVHSTVFSPDGHTLAWTTPNDGISLWDIAKGREAGEPFVSAELKNPLSLAFSPDQTMLAVGDAASALVVWDLAERQPYVLRGHGSQVWSLSFSRDSKVLASAGSFDGKVILWDVAGGGEPIGLPLEGHSKGVSSVTFLGSGDQLATGGWDGKIIIWSTNRGPAISRQVRHATDWVATASFTADGKLLGLANEKGFILWDPTRQQQAGERLATEALVNRIVFSADGRGAMSVSGNDVFTAWDVGQGKQVGQPLLLPQLAGPVTASAVSPDLKTIAAGSGAGIVTLWDVTTRSPIGHKLEHGALIQSMAFNADGRYLVVGNADGAIAIWNIPALTPRGRSLVGHSGKVLSLALSNDGRLLASGGADGSLIFWDVDRGAQAGDPLEFGDQLVTSVAISPDKSVVAAGTSNGGITFIDADTRAAIGPTLRGHSFSVEAMAFNPADGKTLISESQDGRTLLWDVGADSWLDRACRIANRNLTCREWRQYLRGGDNAVCPSLPRTTCEE